MTKTNPSEEETFKIPDPVVLGRALMDAYEQAQPLFEEYMKKFATEDGITQFSTINFDPLNIQDSAMDFLDRVAQEPDKFLEIQAEFAQDWMSLWQDSMHKFMGEAAQTPLTKRHLEPEKGDRRFKAPEWQESALFEFIKQSYLLTCHHLEKTIDRVDGLEENQKEKLRFQMNLFTSAISPTNFFLTNPEVLNETMRTGGENLVKGFKNLLRDLEDGQGELSIRTTDYNAFELGKNIAVTKGQVVYQNDIMQLIQYAPKTEKVYKIPLLIVPPWINKYYILDLRPGNSFIECAVEQGHTVFTISWVNPDASLSQKNFEDYMNEGILDALKNIEKITGETQTNAVGYCLGGTLLTTTLAYLAQKKQENRIASATLLTTLLDFEHAGDMKLFLDDAHLDYIDQVMGKQGILEGKMLRQTFALMRSNDLIWSFVVNNYLMGREPFPFDMLYWNNDSTNMPAALHRFVLRNMYKGNKLIEPNVLSMNDTPIDLSKIKTPCHFISTREDHIAPWKATYAGAQTIGSNVTFTLAASGHIAGVINPPAKNKYCYWSNNSTGRSADEWLDSAKQHDGSWWPAWHKWITPLSGSKVTARKPAKGLEPAPGSYAKKTC